MSQLAWHPTDNLLSYTTHDGELYMHTGFIPQTHVGLLERSLESAPMLNEPLSEVSGNARRSLFNGDKPDERRRAGTPDSLDDLLPPDAMSESGDPFIEDDDGARPNRGNDISWRRCPIMCIEPVRSRM